MGFRPAARRARRGMSQHVFAYDWRRDLVESARRLDETLDALADARGDADTRFNIVGHSMGGLIARYYLRYGTAEPDPDAPVTWAGARRIRNLILVAVPNAGGVHALEALLLGNRVGLSYATLASPVVTRMPSVYQLLPPVGRAGAGRPHRASRSTPTCTTSRPGGASAGGRSAPPAGAWSRSTTAATRSSTPRSWRRPCCARAPSTPRWPARPTRRARRRSSSWAATACPRWPARWSRRSRGCRASSR